MTRRRQTVFPPDRPLPDELELSVRWHGRPPCLTRVCALYGTALRSGPGSEEMWWVWGRGEKRAGGQEDGRGGNGLEWKPVTGGKKKVCGFL